MIVADTSIWIDHLRGSDRGFSLFLERRNILIHPFVMGEISLGNLQQYTSTLNALGKITKAPVASEEDVLSFIHRHRLFGTGIGYVDAHLLTSASLVAGYKLWTRDKRLHRAALALNLASEM